MNSMKLIWDKGGEVVARSIMGETGRPCARSLSPCSKNSCRTLDVHLCHPQLQHSRLVVLLAEFTSGQLLPVPLLTGCLSSLGSLTVVSAASASRARSVVLESYVKPAFMGRRAAAEALRS